MTAAEVEPDVREAQEPQLARGARFLAHCAAGGKKEKELMNYELVPTTVFTPLEYGMIGLSEADAKDKFGAKNVSTYHTLFKPLEWAMHKFNDKLEPERCYVKVIVNKADKNRVIGFHICAPNAGEIT